MKRSDGVFTNPKQIESWMKELYINFEEVQNRRVDGLSEVVIEKYALGAKESEYVENLLKDRDYIVQTSWVLKF